MSFLVQGVIPSMTSFKVFYGPVALTFSSRLLPSLLFVVEARSEIASARSVFSDASGRLFRGAGQ